MANEKNPGTEKPEAKDKAKDEHYASAQGQTLLDLRLCLPDE